MEQNTTIATTDDNRYLFDFGSAKQTYSSLVPKTHEEMVNFFNAVNSPTKRLKEMVNLEVEVKNIYAETIDFIDRETGESVPGVRIVLIAPDGTSYQASSKGVFSSVSKLLQIFGEPKRWKNPVKIRPKEVSKGTDRNVLVFDIVA